MPIALRTNIEEIRAYTRQHPELLSVPYFLFDLHLDKEATDPPIVVMGINPGRPKNEEALIGPTEETSLHDFHDTFGKKRHELKWTKDLIYVCGTSNIVQTELFFWCTRDTKTLREVFGNLAKSPHLQFCKRHNLALLDTHRPRLVVFPGLTHVQYPRELFGLEGPYHTVVNQKGRRIVQEFSDGKRPWLVCKHLSGAAAISGAEKAAIRQYIREVLDRQQGQ